MKTKLRVHMIYLHNLTQIILHNLTHTYTFISLQGSQYWSQFGLGSIDQLVEPGGIDSNLQVRPGWDMRDFYDFIRIMKIHEVLAIWFQYRRFSTILSKWPALAICSAFADSKLSHAWHDSASASSAHNFEHCGIMMTYVPVWSIGGTQDVLYWRQSWQRSILKCYEVLKHGQLANYVQFAAGPRQPLLLNPLEVFLRKNGGYRTLAIFV